jgi:hypothetical protein
MPSNEVFQKQDAEIVKQHLANALIDHSKLVDTIVIWTVLMRDAFAHTHPELDYDAIFASVCNIDAKTIEAMAKGLQAMLAGNKCIVCNPWQAFKSVGINAGFPTQVGHSCLVC